MAKAPLPLERPYMKNRREFLQHSAVTVCAACGLIGGGCSSDGGSPPADSISADITLDSTDTAALANNGSTLTLTSTDYSDISGQLLMCRDSSGTLRAFSGSCPHAESTLSFDASNSYIECKQTSGGHGARFAFDGSCTTAPAGASTNYSLRAYTVSESGTTITVSLA